MPGDQRLVAYLVSRGSPPDPSALRERLKARLPEYMVPAHFVLLERMPHTPNGKVDRRALPAPDGSNGRAPRLAAECAPPASELESRLALLWKETLGLDRVGVEDNFFDLGGHSLLVVRLQRRMGEVTSRPVSLTDLFRFPTIRSLSRFLSGDGERSPGERGPGQQGSVEEATQRGRRRRDSLQRRRQGAAGS